LTMIRALLVSVGFLCVGVGTVGIFMPILPATPFYLLATICFTKGSTRFHRWFTRTKLYKEHFKSFAESRRMTLKAKMLILIPVSVMLLLTCLAVDVLVVRIIISVLLAIKIWYFLFIIKTIQRS